MKTVRDFGNDMTTASADEYKLKLMTKTRDVAVAGKDMVVGTLADFKNAMTKTYNGETMQAEDFKGPLA